MFTQNLVFDIIKIALRFDIASGLYSITWKYIRLYFMNYKVVYQIIVSSRHITLCTCLCIAFYSIIKTNVYMITLNVIIKSVSTSTLTQNSSTWQLN